jgi:hypothetical protein
MAAQTHLDLDGITRQDIAAVRKGLVAAAELNEMVKRAASCGTECDDIREQAEFVHEYLKRVNDIYGPQFPSRG